MRPGAKIRTIALVAAISWAAAEARARASYELPSMTNCRVWYAGHLTRIFGIAVPISNHWTMGIDELGCLPVDGTRFHPVTRVFEVGGLREIEVEGDVEIAPIDPAACPCCHDERYASYSLAFHGVVVDGEGRVVWRAHGPAADGARIGVEGGTFRYRLRGEYRGESKGEKLWIYATASFPCNAGVIVLGAKSVRL